MERRGLIARGGSCASVAKMKVIEIAGGGLTGLSLGIALRERGCSGHSFVRRVAIPVIGFVVNSLMG